ncbi:MAG: 30S ribosomal protein S8 [Nitrospirae bacterium]|jgi:small subunit ribosomal protein S8|nr:30S ribosomal protein S8 [Nitrospirota bacterium]MCL5062067.1 30S ribosomal protein S8 [Nitrospirota bacterium]MDA8213874.1 30S ribosomal protein S8 [Nitrospiraceae bacterium]MDA8338549.1 30S ribosomal protein S8 [Nitrospiraceae bacterium]
MLTDPIADMLTRMRNAILIKSEKVDIPASKMKVEVAKILKEEGFIKSYKIIKDKKQGILRVTLKYTPENESVVTGLKRISKPGRRVYIGKSEIPKVMGGVGIAIITTPKGMLSDKECRGEGVGGEVLCYVW